MTRFGRAVVLLLATMGVCQSTSSVSAQLTAIPADEDDLYLALDDKLRAFDETIAAAWDGSPFPVDASAELQSAHSNRGAQLLDPYRYFGILAELGSLKALGVKAVTVSINFPIFHPSIYASAAEYQLYVDFYTRLAADIRARGLKLIVKTGPTFAATSFGIPGVRALYDSLTLAEYRAGRAETARAIAMHLEPDYLTVILEPDTEADQSGKAELGTVIGSTALLNVILDELQQSDLQGIAIGAGFGSWMPSYQSFLGSFSGTAVDYIDAHVYPVNHDYLPRLLEIADVAAAHGKRVAISEAWLTKLRDVELITMPIDVAFARDPFSFWSPLDARFLSVLMDYAEYKQLLFVSPFWTDRFHAYLDYDTTENQSLPSLLAEAARSVTQGIGFGQYTETGLSYSQRLIDPPDVVAPSIPGNVWAASGSRGISVLWRASTDTVGVAGYQILRDGELIGTTSRLFYRDVGFAPNSTHTYQITAYDASGNVSSHSTSVTARTRALRYVRQPPPG